MRIVVAFVVVLGCSSEPAAVVLDSGQPDSALDAPDTHVVHGEDARRETAPEIPPPEVPATLAETGLYSDFASRTLAPEVIAYDVRYPLWTDGAEKARFLYVPKGRQIDTSDLDHWSYPLGTKAWKELRRGGVLLETRYLEKTGEPPLGWKYVAYVWSKDGESALAAKKGVTDALGTVHDVPSQEQCEQCHSGTRDGLIGPGAIQLELARFAEKGLLSAPPGREFSPPGTGIVKDALGYLHGNCGYCHSDAGRWSSVRKLRLRVRVSDTEPAKTPTYLTTVNAPMAHFDGSGSPYTAVIPGNAEGSHLFVRTYQRNEWAMPPVGSEIADGAGLTLLKAWIDSMK